MLTQLTLNRITNSTRAKSFDKVRRNPTATTLRSTGKRITLLDEMDGLDESRRWSDGHSSEDECEEFEESLKARGDWESDEDQSEVPEVGDAAKVSREQRKEDEWNAQRETLMQKHLRSK